MPKPERKLHPKNCKVPPVPELSELNFTLRMTIPKEADINYIKKMQNAEEANKVRSQEATRKVRRGESGPLI